MNQIKLRQIMLGRGYKTRDLADNLGISCESFNRKLRLDCFKVKEAAKIRDFLQLSSEEFSDIFYPKTNLVS